MLVPEDEQIKRLNAARFQLDIMRVPGIIVARTDAEAASLIEGNGDERDQPFILGATDLAVPPYKLCYLALLKRLHDVGVEALNGHQLYAVSDAEYDIAFAWFDHVGLESFLRAKAEAFLQDGHTAVDRLLDEVANRFLETWEDAAGLNTYAEAVAEVIEFRSARGERVGMTADEWRKFAGTASLYRVKENAGALDIDIDWGLRVAEDARRLLPGTGRNPVCGRQVAGRGTVRGPVVDGDEDGEARRRAGVRRGDSRGVPGQDAVLQPVPVVQLGHDRHV